MRRERRIRRRQVAWRTTGKRSRNEDGNSLSKRERRGEADGAKPCRRRTRNHKDRQIEREASMKDEDKVHGTKTRRRHWKGTNEVIKDRQI